MFEAVLDDIPSIANRGGDTQMAPPPAPAIAVRPATAADAATIADLAAELGYHVAADAVRQRLAALPATHIVLVATDPGRVAGLAVAGDHRVKAWESS
jgi:hypothetical protein